jgi:hypothetical protein
MTHVESGELHQRMIVPSIFPTSTKSRLFGHVAAVMFAHEQLIAVWSRTTVCAKRIFLRNLDCASEF